jgi:hypothetical protein
MHKQIAFLDIAPPAFSVYRPAGQPLPLGLELKSDRKETSTAFWVGTRGAIRETQIVDDFACRKTGESFNLS